MNKRNERATERLYSYERNVRGNTRKERRGEERNVRFNETCLQLRLMQLRSGHLQSPN